MFTHNSYLILFGLHVLKFDAIRMLHIVAGTEN